MLFFDVDTQIDFTLPVGALYAKGAEQTIPALARLTEFARQSHIRILSTADAHAPQDPEFAEWPPHCVAGTLSQRKLPETLLANAVVIPNLPGPLPDGWPRAPQVIVEKQTVDMFHTHTLTPLLEALGAKHYVVYGMVTEVCVMYAAQGLLRTGAKVDVVTDAVRELDPARGRRILAELQAAGARLLTTEQITQA